MATASETSARNPLAPAAIDYLLSLGTLAMFATVATALLRGHAEWGHLPPRVWFHVATIMLVLVLSPVMLLRTRGDRLHRVLGYVWLGSMVATALVSFTLRFLNNGSFSFIHLLSALVLFLSWKVVRNARRHQAKAHRSDVRGLIFGGLLLAGFFTFQFDRLLGQWLMGRVVFD